MSRFVFVILLIAAWAWPMNQGRCSHSISAGSDNHPAIVINEIMFRPFSGQPEWIELFNRGDEPVALDGWAISDSDTSRRSFVPAVHAMIPAGGFVVLSQADLSAEIMDVNVPCVVFDRFPRLNNDGDSVVLFDVAGSIHERVDYDSWWSGSNGISIERINPHGPSDDVENWSASVSASGSTPGKRNSLFAIHVLNTAELSASPNPFSPDGDGFEDVTEISYKLPMTTANTNLRIYDVSGRLIRSLKGANPSGSQGQVFWDGLNNGLRPVPAGLYIIYIEGVCQSTGQFASAKCTVALTRRD